MQPSQELSCYCMQICHIQACPLRQDVEEEDKNPFRLQSQNGTARQVDNLNQPSAGLQTLIIWACV